MIDASLQISAAQAGYSNVVAHMLRELPNECVGLLWSDGSISRLINQARSPSRFSAGGAQIAEAMEKVDQDLLLAAVYHSHPGGRSTLSDDDENQLRLQFAAGVAIPWLIVNPSGDMRVWWWSEEDDRAVGFGIMAMETAGVRVTD